MHAEDVVFIDAGDLDAARKTLAEGDIAAVIAEPVQERAESGRWT